MLTFLHLSDIHFRRREGGPQFDLDAQLRKAVLTDIAGKPADGADYDGVLISGDIAFGGKKTEYDIADGWLRELEKCTGIEPSNTYVVPGNHDVDRDVAIPDGALWDGHQAIRRCKDDYQRSEQLRTKLTKDPVGTPLLAVNAFNDFAQKYGCRTRNEFEPATDPKDPPRLAWQALFPKPLDDGSLLRLHGLNSALISDESDVVGSLYVSQFQTQHLCRAANVCELIMCHHPSNWLIDKTTFEDAILAHAHVALFGHEHTYRVRRIDNTVHVFAGAVHPSRRDPEWKPTYHIVQLSVRGSGAARQLAVTVHTRVHDGGYAFVPFPDTTGALTREYELPLAEWTGAEPITLVCTGTSEILSDTTESAVNQQSAPDVLDSAFREVLVHFHRLSTPVRYNIATKLALLRDGDDFPPQQQWDLVLQRARDEQRLADLWAEIALKDSAFARRPNPFKKSNP